MMDLGHTLFSPNGRISQNEYWVGILIMVGGNLFLTWLPVIGMLIWVGLFYVGAVVCTKRLHDSGRTGWIHLIPWAIFLSLTGFGIVVAGGAALAPFFDELGRPDTWAMLSSGDLDPKSQAQLIGGGIVAAGVLLLFWSLAALTWVVYTIWLGLLPSDPGENAFGPAPTHFKGAPLTPKSAGAPPTES